jgi:hydroxyacylglutathione hydrolase
MGSALGELVELSAVVDPTFDQNCYLLRRRDTDEVLAVDPGLQHAEVVAHLERRGLRCSSILLTHGHPDHVSGVPALRAAFECPAAIHPADRPMLAHVAGFPGVPEDLPAVVAEDDLLPQSVVHWQGLDIAVLHTPGHTPGSVSFLLGSDLYAGDTLFQRSVGRTDLPGGSWDQLMASIQDTIYTLAPETIVYPGHGPRTTVGEEMRFNPFAVHPQYR